jgi:hypothetical protein
MKIGAFELNEPVPELRDPHVLAMIRPWVDVGSVGTITLRRFERHFGAKELGKLARPGTFFDFTRYRPNTRIVDGQRVTTIPNSHVNYAHPDEGPDLIFLHLMEPHAMAEDYVESVVALIEHFNVKAYCRVGAMYDSVPHTRPIIVTGTSGSFQPRPGSTPPLIEQRQSQYEGPTTILNLLTDELTRLDVRTMNFMAHLPHYAQMDEDYAGAARMLQVLAAYYNIPETLGPSRRGARQYAELDAAADRQPELKSLVSRLEAYYDSRYETSSKESESPTEPETKTELPPEIERFLKELDPGP